MRSFQANVILLKIPKTNPHKFQSWYHFETDQKLQRAPSYLAGYPGSVEISQFYRNSLAPSLLKDWEGTTKYLFTIENKHISYGIFNYLKDGICTYKISSSRQNSGNMIIL